MDGNGQVSTEEGPQDSRGLLLETSARGAQSSAPGEAGASRGPRLTAPVCSIPCWVSGPEATHCHIHPLPFLAGLLPPLPEASTGPRLGFLPSVLLFPVLIAH